MKTILDENNMERDMELSEIKKVPLMIVNSIDISNPENIIIYNSSNKKPITENEYKNLYSKYTNLDLLSYLKVLMYTSVHKRGRNLKNKLNLAKGNCLDFGSGVGTHTIYLLEKGNKVWILDVPGSPLLQFTLERINYRNLNNNFKSVILDSKLLPINFYDYINCLDVLEHCFDPLKEIKLIYKSLKRNGLLHLQVSEMIKSSSGHFKESIDIWKINGKKFLLKYFIEEENNIYRKIK